MLSSSFDISEFIDKVKGHSDQEIIYMADREATAAERYVHQHKCKSDSDRTIKADAAGDARCEPYTVLLHARHYVVLLKDFVQYMRYGVLTQSVRRLDLDLPDSMRNH